MNKKQINKLVNIFRYVTWIKVIAITGGPCAGKSTFLKMAIKMLEKWGIVVIVVPEVARELISSGITPWNPDWKKSTDFQRHIILNALTKEALFFKALLDMDLKGKKVVFLCDRGIPDGMAYCGKETFFKLLSKMGISYNDILERYDAVIHLVTAAIGAPDFYVTDEERRETLMEAVALDIATREAWLPHQHFSLVDNTGTFDHKILRALLALRRTIDMPKAQEIERKFLLKRHDFNGIEFPAGTQSFELFQDYLDRSDRPGIECRVRLKVLEGVSSYVYTEKTQTEEEGVRGENEEKITEARYQELLAAYGNPKWNQIRKTRYKIPLEGEHVMELDEYHDRLQGLVVAEVEFKSTKDMEQFVMPKFIGKHLDVTADERYSNASLAKNGWPT